MIAKLFFAFFATWLAAYFTFEIVPNFVPTYVWIVMFLAFLPMELTGAIRGTIGDTLSEAVWGFIKGGEARQLFGVALALALASRMALLMIQIEYEYLYQINPVHILGWWNHIPGWILCLGIFSWLAQHFPGLGKTG